MKIVKADTQLEGIEGKNKPTEFMYLQCAVNQLRKQNELICKILEQNRLTLKLEESPKADIEDNIWDELMNR